jgi:hypothetical protein
MTHDPGDATMRHLMTFALAGLFGSLLLVGDASACLKLKCACPAPAPAPAPVCAPKICHWKMPKFKLNFCHKKAACETYAAPVASPQSM